MLRTRVGYAGGSTRNPTYRSIGDHAETVQIDYDPERITYGDLLAVFGKKHDPAGRSWSRQYASLVLYHSDEQRRMAEQWKKRIEGERGRSVATEIVPVGVFTLAEDYHQKHSLQFFPEVLEELRAYYPSTQDMLGSTAVTRINGYIAGEGNCDALDGELASLGLSDRLQEKLRERVCGSPRPAAAACPVPPPR